MLKLTTFLLMHSFYRKRILFYQYLHYRQYRSRCRSN